jgi:hypothetical protein
LRDEGFYCSFLGVLYGGLEISKLQFLIEIKFNFSILANETLDPDPESGSAVRKNAGSGSESALNQCGSATLPGAD